MCTVVFIPGKDKTFFASLRDENPARQKATAPAFTAAPNGNYIAPLDPAAGGTWLGINEFGNVIILLNGGFSNHTKKSNYCKSRGMIVKELLADSMPVVEWNLMCLENVEPFTLIVWSNEKLFQLVWDGMEKHRISLPATEPYIWSSATLYDDAAQKYRALLFKNWIAMDPVISTVALFDFFKQYDDHYNGFLMNRKEMTKTLSYTFISLQKSRPGTIVYRDLATGTESSISLARSKKQHCFM